MILERQIQQQQGQQQGNSNNINNNNNTNENQRIKKLEEENKNLEEQFLKYKQNTQKKIVEFSEKLNRGINSTQIMKEVSNSTELTNRLEKQTKIINEKNIEITQLNNMVRNYLIGSKKQQFDQRDEFLGKLQNFEDLNSLNEVLSHVLKHVEERERKVKIDLLSLEEKKVSHQYYKSKCEELEYKYEKKNPETGEKQLNRKRKYSLKENEGPILGEIDPNKKIKNIY